MSNKTVNIIFIGDIVGSSGRTALRQLLPDIRDEWDADIVIANGENAAHGFGLTPSTAKEIYDAGVDFITGGNHTWDKKEIVQALREFDGRMIRPSNYPPNSPGRGSGVVNARGGEKIGIINVMGRIFMDPLDCPFRAADRELERVSKEARIILVDIHAEATSEKAAMAAHLDGRVSAVVGSHTHVQTADERISQKGTGFLTDAGMTGPLQSIIGMKTEIILRRFLEKRPIRMEVADGPGTVQGVVFRIDRESAKCESISRIQRINHGC